MTKKHIHFIGICGVAMSAIAIAFQKKGWVVTGSDAGFFPPISTHLRKHKINFYPGWHPEKMTKNGNPDLVVVGNVASSANPEWQYVQKNKIPYKSYPEVIADFFVKKNSIVCAGTYGKTSNTTLLTWILKTNKYNPSYMFGGISVNMEESAEITNGDWNVLEGDEYKTARWDNNPKFFLYSPTHLLLTSASWDHIDVYPTENSYYDAFKNLLNLIPENGLLVVPTDGKNIKKIIKNYKNKIIKYGKKPGNDYIYKDVEQTKKGLKLKIVHKNKTYKIKVPILGEYMAENICGCFAMAMEIGLKPRKIIKSIGKFRGIKRRLEKRLDSNIVVFDDIAHSPDKAKATLKTLRSIYKNKIIAVFEPNTGNRLDTAAPFYKNAFKNADMVVIPQLTKIKRDPKRKEKALRGSDLAKIINSSTKNAIFMRDDKKLVNYIIDNTKKGDIVVFLGSHGFRGMIDELVRKLN